MEGPLCFVEEVIDVVRDRKEGDPSAGLRSMAGMTAEGGAAASAYLLVGVQRRGVQEMNLAGVRLS